MVEFKDHECNTCDFRDCGIGKDDVFLACLLSKHKPAWQPHPLYLEYLRIKNLTMPFSLEGKVAIITGGLGQLGRQYTKAIIDAGAKVATFDIVPGSPYLVDITSKESVKKGVEAVVKDLGVPSILINNAAIDAPPGSAGGSKPFEDYPIDDLDKVFDVNVKGMIICCQEIGKIMAEHKNGSIINISSIYGNVSPDQRIYEYRQPRFVKPVAYSVTKAAVLNLTRYLATYWAKDGVRVNTLSLGGVFNNQDPEFLKNYTTKVPLGRMAREDEYNGAIVFLASDASSYMTGSNMIIDGGYIAW